MAGPLVIATAVAAPCSAQQAGGTLKLGHFTSPASMSMLEESTVAVNRPMMGVFNNLVMFKQDEVQNTPDSIVPELATSWSWNEDGTELTMPLHQGVKWHDGKPFTSADVKCTMDLLQGKGPEKLRVNPRKAWFDNVASVTANGDYEVTFHLKRPQPSLLSMLATGWTPMYPCHVSPAQMRQHPIGTGPFKFVEFKPNQSITVVAQPGLLETGQALSRRHRIPHHSRCLDPAAVVSRRQRRRLYRRDDAAVERCEAAIAGGDLRMFVANVARNMLINRDVTPFDNRAIAARDLADDRSPGVCRYHRRRAGRDRRGHAAAAGGRLGHAALCDAQPAGL